MTTAVADVYNTLPIAQTKLTPEEDDTLGMNFNLRKMKFHLSLMVSFSFWCSNKFESKFLLLFPCIGVGCWMSFASSAPISVFKPTTTVILCMDIFVPFLCSFALLSSPSLVSPAARAHNGMNRVPPLPGLVALPARQLPQLWGLIHSLKVRVIKWCFLRLLMS